MVCRCKGANSAAQLRALLLTRWRVGLADLLASHMRMCSNAVLGMVSPGPWLPTQLGQVLADPQFIRHSAGTLSDLINIPFTTGERWWVGGLRASSKPCRAVRGAAREGRHVHRRLGVDLWSAGRLMCHSAAALCDRRAATRSC